jgi:hypothetical protein
MYDMEVDYLRNCGNFSDYARFLKKHKIFKTTDSKTLNLLMKPETINKTNSIPAKVPVPITNRFKTMLEAKRIMKTKT